MRGSVKKRALRALVFVGPRMALRASLARPTGLFLVGGAPVAPRLLLLPYSSGVCGRSRRAGDEEADQDEVENVGEDASGEGRLEKTEIQKKAG